MRSFGLRPQDTSRRENTSVAHIAVIDPAVKIAELECFNWLARNSLVPLTHHLPGLVSTPHAPCDDGLSGIIVLGSSSSVHDNLPWQQALIQWLKPRLDQGVPTLGLCFGHQLIAHLYGGKVGFLSPDRSKRQGFYSIELTQSRLWPAATGQIFVSHREFVTHCPPGFRTMASSSEVPIEGLEHERLPLWTFQSHPEATTSFLSNVGFTTSADNACFDFGHGIVKKFLVFAAQRLK